MVRLRGSGVVRDGGAVVLDLRHGGDQLARVLLDGRAEEHVAVGALDDAAVAQHDDLLRHVADHAEVVRDDRYVSPSRLLQLVQQVEHLRLDRHVERGDGLVEHDEARAERERTGDPDALALAAGEAARVALGEPPAELDEVEQLGDAPSALLAPDAVDRERLGDRPCDRAPRVQRRDGILEDELAVAAERAQPLAGRRVTSAPSKLSVPRVGRLQAGHEPAERRTCPSPTRRRGRRFCRPG